MSASPLFNATLRKGRTNESPNLGDVPFNIQNPHKKCEFVMSHHIPIWKPKLINPEYQTKPNPERTVPSRICRGAGWIRLVALGFRVEDNDNLVSTAV